MSPEGNLPSATLPENLYSGADKLLWIDLTLSDSTGRAVSRNFYWVPATLTTFDWGKTSYVTTPAERYEDLTALASLPKAYLNARAFIYDHHSIVVRLTNTSLTLAFQVHAAIRTHEGAQVAPVLWSDNWIEIPPGETRVLTTPVPLHAGLAPLVQLDGWNIAPQSLTPVTAYLYR